MIPDEVAVAVVGALGITVGYVIKAIAERKSLTAVAAAQEASATTAVIAAARDLVEPLRRELTLERAEVKRVRDELAAALEDSHKLRAELEEMRREMREMESAYQRRITQLEEALRAAAG